MKKLFEIVIAVQTIGGAIFFAALFVSPLPLSSKVLAGIALIFISSGVFLLLVNQMAFFESFRTFIEQMYRAIESQQMDDGRLRTYLRQYFESKSFDGIRMKSTSRLGYLLIAMFVFWFICGWVLTRYVV